ncbi:MAG: DUF1947 domain-containing protein [Sebaldella sp.]|nr:DUF1947 domain-containing protein [Sebaldella sp.]
MNEREITFEDKKKEITKFLKKIKGIYSITIEGDLIDFFDNESERHTYYLDDNTIFFKLMTNYSTLETAKTVIKVIEFLKLLGFKEGE